MFYPIRFVLLVFISNQLQCNCCSGCSASRQTATVRSVAIQSVQHSLALCWKTLQWRHQANAMKTTASKDARWRRQMERVRLLHDCVTSGTGARPPPAAKNAPEKCPEIAGIRLHYRLEWLAAKRVSKLESFDGKHTCAQHNAHTLTESHKFNRAIDLLVTYSTSIRSSAVSRLFFI